jgi:hypothetical protein
MGRTEGARMAPRHARACAQVICVCFLASLVSGAKRWAVRARARAASRAAWPARD